MRVKMRTMGRGAQGPPAHLGSVDLVNCVRGWLRSLWSVSEEPASETGNYRTSCNCCKTGGHMRELVLLYGCLWVHQHVCEGENESLISTSQVLLQHLKKNPVKPQQIQYEIFDATSGFICKSTTLDHLVEINWSRSKGILPTLEINKSFSSHRMPLIRREKEPPMHCLHPPMQPINVLRSLELCNALCQQCLCHFKGCVKSLLLLFLLPQEH